MLTAAAFASTTALLAALVPTADAHGYIAKPASQFKGAANSAWVVQIDPVWKSDKWDGNNPGSVEVFTSFKSVNNFKDLKTLMDDTSVYGQDCGFTDPNGTPQPIPTDGKATFSRGLIHVGPCEIWLDDNKVLSEDDCYSKYGNPNQDVITTFPVDYSSCNNGGCKEMRCYCLGFQGLVDKTVWQSYKNCIPLTGSGGGSSTSTSTPTSPSNSTSQTSQTSSSSGALTPTTGDAKPPSSDDSKTPSSDNSKTPTSDDSKAPSSDGSKTQSSGDSKTPSSSDNSATPAPASNDSPSTEAPTTQGSSADTPKATTAPSFSFK